jgi:hypothetical protein
VKHGVSVSVLLERGVMTGQLVKECGQLPVCNDKEYCSMGCGDFTASQLRKAYVVVEASWRKTYDRRAAAFGELSAENLKVVIGRVGCLALLEGGSSDDDWFVRFLEHGLCQSDAVCCGCSMYVLCEDCAMLDKTKVGRRFILVKEYMGPFPRSDVRWFTGVTDVMGAKRTQGGVGARWLSC